VIKLDINETLGLEIVTGRDAHIVIARAGGGLIRLEPQEIRHLVRALVEGACRLADAAIEVQR